MTLKHNPQTSLLASADSSSINQLLTTDNETTDITVFRRIGNNQLVSVVIVGLVDDLPAENTNYEVDLERSIDGGETWAVHQTFNGPSSIDLPYPNGSFLWRFRLVSVGEAESVRIQATA